MNKQTKQYLELRKLKNEESKKSTIGKRLSACLRKLGNN